MQVGPQIADGTEGLRLMDLSVAGLCKALQQRDLATRGVLFSTPIRSCSAHAIRKWPGPTLLACGDLHHGPDPIGTLQRYCAAEPHDAVQLTFNPALLQHVQQRLLMPVRCLAPTFFRYPAATPSPKPSWNFCMWAALAHITLAGVSWWEALLRRQEVPFRHATTSNAEEAAQLYAKHALVLNVPLNQDLNPAYLK